jgi:hypothetical protein
MECMKSQKLKIFGANLQDQSLGQFVVHDTACQDCKKLEKLKEHCTIETHTSLLSVARSIWNDMISEGEMTAEDGLDEIHFCPCVKLTMFPADFVGTLTGDPKQ